MMDKIYLYILAVSDDDYFAEMAATSMQSLIISNSQSKFKIVLLCDTFTSKANSPGMCKIKELCDEIVVINVQHPTSVLRSRYLKVNAIQILGRPFIYLDCDTLIMGSLDGLWDSHVDIALTRDLWGSSSKNELNESPLEETYRRLNWGKPAKLYLNTGVVYINSNDRTNAFGRRLALEWETQVEITGKPNDQYVFNYVKEKISLTTKIISVRYNAQLVINPLIVRNAIVVHVFTGDFKTRQDTILHLVAKKLKKENVFDTEALDLMVKYKNPWTKLDTWQKHWSVASYLGALHLGFIKLTRRLISF
jgi:lipopolysaccharide biosynthesis glycosyltransferase